MQDYNYRKMHDEFHLIMVLAGRVLLLFDALPKKRTDFWRKMAGPCMQCQGGSQFKRLVKGMALLIV